MPSHFNNSIFYDFFIDKSEKQNNQIAILGGNIGSSFSPKALLKDLPIVVFDFETTGLNSKTNKIIEIGAIKYVNQKEIARFSELINPQIPISAEITKITGITNDVVKDAKTIEHVLPAFHDFLRGTVGVAHNAEFDAGFLYYESLRIGIHCNYYLICTLKMAKLLLKIEKRNLDALATYYNLTFESRHRSIGDIIVTGNVLWSMLKDNPNLQTIVDFAPYQQLMSFN